MGSAAEAYGNNLLEEVLYYGQRAKVIAETEDFDVIHAHDWLAYPAGLMAKKVSGKPLIVHVHATEYDRGGGNGINPQVYEIERQGMQGADGVITVSQLTKNLVMKHYGIPEQKIKVSHNGLKLVPEHSSAANVQIGGLEQLKAAGNQLVLFVGRITLQKGPDYFVRM